MNVVTEQNFDEVYPSEIRNRYWRVVRISLERIFGKPGGLADQVRRDIDGSPVSEQILTYHQEPIHLAADLAGVSTITPEHRRKYLEICEDTEPSRVGWPDRP